MTPEQMKDKERLQAYIHREQLASVMCDSKWRRLVAVIRDVPFGCGFWCKDVRWAVRDEPYWDGDIYHVFAATESIEWVEINTKERRSRGRLLPTVITDHTDELRAALLAANVPFSIENGNVRVWGYTRPGLSPKWETTHPSNSPSADSPPSSAPGGSTSTPR